MRLCQRLWLANNRFLFKRNNSTLTTTNQARVSVGIQNMSVGDQYHGFTLNSIREIEELSLTVLKLSHTKTGADYLHISRDDPDNVFSVAFRTAPEDSTGVPHILEHTVLCGSKLYPTRDPFFKMLNRSLSTFMNAMTGSDYTMYPFSTQNAKDFRNLLSVYLDAVFRPELRELDFLQEGWRLEHENPADPATPLRFKGVVFNEMKGAYCDPSYYLNQEIMKNLLPSNAYRHSSGGHPLDIVDLTWENLKKFHSALYHPSNAKFYTYGDMELIRHLQFIQENYLTQFNQIPSSRSIPNESKWNSGRRIDISCRPDPFASGSSVVVSYALNDVADPHETFVLQIIGGLLTEGPNSAFYRSLLEPNIGTGFSPITGFDPSTKDSTFSVGLQGIRPEESAEKVVELIDSTFRQAAVEGFLQERVDSVLHSIELGVKHQSGRFGLAMAMNLTPLWMHGADPAEALAIQSKVDRFRRDLAADPDYLKKKIRLYFVENGHRLVSVMKPDDQFEPKMAEAEESILARKIENLNSDQRSAILSKSRLLLDMQNNKDDKAECLPTLELTDVSKFRPDSSQLEHVVSSGGVRIQVATQPTNGVTYFRAIIDTAALPDHLQRHLPLFCAVATQMGAGSMDYRQLDQRIAATTGGLSLDIHMAEHPHSGGRSYEQGIQLSSHCLDRNTSAMFDLWSTILNDLTLADEKRLETLIRSLVADVSNNLVQSGHHYAVTHAGSCLTPSAERKELDQGLTYLRRIKAVAELSQFPELMDAMRDIAGFVLKSGAKFSRCALNVSEGSKASALDRLEGFLRTVSASPNPESKIWTNDADVFRPTIQRYHHVLPVPVHFNSKVFPAVPYLSPDFAPLRILAGMMTAKFLHAEVREKGGAYGAGATASASGLFSFYSYRDPESMATLEAFDRSVDWALRPDGYTDVDVKEAKLRIFQQIDAPISPSGRGMRLFSSHLTDDQFQRHRQQLMDATKDDLIRVADRYLRSPDVYGVTILGPSSDVTAKDVSWNVQFS